MSIKNIFLKKENKQEEFVKTINKPDTKRSITKFKKEYKKQLSPESYFFVRNGQIIKGMDELVPLLANLNDEMFRFHVNNFKNDFYNWIVNVFKDGILGDSIKNIKDRKEMINVLNSMLYQEVEIEEKVTKNTEIKDTNITYTKLKEEEQSDINNTKQNIDKKISVDRKNIEKNIEEKSQVEKKNSSLPSLPSLPILPSLSEKEKEKIMEEEKKASEKENAEFAEDKKDNLDMGKMREEIKAIQNTYASRIKTLGKPKYIVPKNIEDLVSSFNSQLTEIKEKTKDLRKQGQDTKMLELVLMRIPAKIKLFQATEDEKDKNVIQELLEEARKEIQVSSL
jgi:hypothetical protein